MARKIGLGRGLSALIPEEDFPAKIVTGAVEIDIGNGVEPQPGPPADVEPEVSSSPLDISDELDVPVEPDISDEAAISALTDITYDPVEPEPQPDPLEDVEPEVNGSSLELQLSPLEDIEPEVSGSPLETDIEIPVEASEEVSEDVSVEPDISIEPEPQPSPLEGGLPPARDAVVQIAVDKLVPNPGQPRKNFDETELQELADSIKEYGVIMPVIAADTGDGSYTIIAGERRTRAARLAGLEEIPVIIRDYTDLKRMEVSLIENIQRSDLNPIEEATAYKNLMDFSSLSHEELAAKVGKNRSTVSNALRLLKLSAEMQKGLENGDLSPGHARALLSVAAETLREKLFKEITAKGLSVREAEKKAAALNSAGGAPGGGEDGGDAVKEKASKRPPEITEMEEKFIEKLGTKVTIDGGLEKGRIHIEYYSMEDLDRLYELLT